LYSAYKSKESLGASVAKKMCFQRSSERIEGESMRIIVVAINCPANNYPRTTVRIPYTSR